MIERVISNIESGRNTLLTGEGGTGKSYIVHKLKEKYKERMAITATTGIAAMNIGGCTIHSFSRMGTKNHPDKIKNVMSTTSSTKPNVGFEVKSNKPPVI